MSSSPTDQKPLPSRPQARNGVHSSRKRRVLDPSKRDGTTGSYPPTAASREADASEQERRAWHIALDEIPVVGARAKGAHEVLLKEINDIAIASGVVTFTSELTDTAVRLARRAGQRVGMPVPQRKTLREAYGFDDVAIVPGQVTINPELTDVTTEIAGQHLQVPILAAAMDAVVDPEFAVKVGARGGLAVLNLEGLQCRFDDPEAVLEEVAASDTEGATAILQRAYTTPIRDELVGRRVAEIKAGGAAAAVSVTPPRDRKSVV